MYIYIYIYIYTYLGLPLHQSSEDGPEPRSASSETVGVVQVVQGAIEALPRSSNQEPDF